MKDQRTFSTDDWEKIKAEEKLHADTREADTLWKLFNKLHHIEDGFGITQRDHSLIMAELVVKDINEKFITEEELVLVALLHDVAKPLSLSNHPAVAAEILKHRISEHAYLLIKYHSFFLGHIINNDNIPNDVPNYAAFLSDAHRLAKYDACSVDPSMPRMTLKEAKSLIYRMYGIDLEY